MHTIKAPKIAIIGAGLAGLNVASNLKDYAEVKLYEKDSQIGGNLQPLNINEVTIDAGSQYFTARTKVFKKFLQNQFNQNELIEWKPRVMTIGPGIKAYRRDWFEPHYRCLPHMNKLCHKLADQLELYTKSEITAINYQDAWILQQHEQQLSETYDWIILALPTPKLSSLLPANCCFIDQIKPIITEPAMAVCLTFNQSLKLNYQAAKIRHSQIDWLYVESSKDPSIPSFNLVLHMTSDFAQEYINSDSQQIIEIATLALHELGINLPEHSNALTKIWPSANLANALEEGFLLDSKLKLAACGEWINQGGIEGAFMSGYLLAQELKKII